MTFPRVSRRRRHFANVGDVIIYPDLVVARTAEQCQEEESGSAFDIHSGTAMEAYDSGSSDDSDPYWNTLKCTPYYQPID